MTLNLGPEHPRTRLVDDAEREMQSAVFTIVKRHDLTIIETLRILSTASATLVKYALRRERHPDDPEKGADDA